MGTTIHDESHVATVAFLVTKLRKHKTWTKEKEQPSLYFGNTSSI